MLRHTICAAENLPKRMSAENVIFLAVGKVRSDNAAFGRSQRTMVQKGFFSKRARLPADHAGGCNCHPIDAASLTGDVSANLVEALPPKELALPGHIRLSLETVNSGII